MRIAVIFMSSTVTDKEEQLVRAIALLPSVSEVVLCANELRSSLRARLQRLRASVEARVASSSISERDVGGLAGGKVRIAALRTVGDAVTCDVQEIDQVVNLSGLRF